MIRKEDIQGFVLAGGKSSRMGRDKAIMEWEGKPLVARAAEVLNFFVCGLVVMGGEPKTHYGYSTIPDEWPNIGPLSALATGLIHSKCDWNIFLACDLPLLSEHFVRLLLDRVQTTECDIVAPYTDDGWHPLCAAYHLRCRPVLERAANEKRNSIVALFRELSVEAITPDQMKSAGVSPTELMNVNTPEDWARATEELKRGGSKG